MEKRLHWKKSEESEQGCLVEYFDFPKEQSYDDTYTLTGGKRSVRQPDAKDSGIFCESLLDRSLTWLWIQRRN